MSLVDEAYALYTRLKAAYDYSWSVRTRDLPLHMRGRLDCATRRALRRYRRRAAEALAVLDTIPEE